MNLSHVKPSYVPNLVILFFLSGLPIWLQAQSPVEGRVYADKTLTQPLEFATVEIRQRPDTVKQNPIYATTTDSAGKFIIPSGITGNFRLLVSLIGYKKRQLDITLDNGARLEPIVLDRDSTTLKTVNVVAEKQMVERKIDRLVFNVDKSPIAGSGTVWDALRYAPGVIQSPKSDVSVNGRIAAIYIDDRPLRLSPEDAANYLKNLPAINIVRIEVMYNPPSSYDAEGGAIVNIITNKKILSGFTGSISSQYQQSHYAKNSNSLNLNYKNNKLTITSLLNFNDGKYLTLEDDYYNYVGRVPPTNWRLNQRRTRESNGLTYQLNAFYDFSSKSSLVVGFDGMNNWTGTNNGGGVKIYDANMSLDSSRSIHSYTKSKTDLYAVNASYTYKIGDRGDMIKLAADRTSYKSNTNQSLSSVSFDKGGAFDNSSAITSGADQQVTITTGKFDITKVLKNGRIEAGAKLSHITTDNPYIFKDSTAGGYILNPNVSNTFKYTEKTQAGYVSMSRDFKKIKTYVGLRVENTQTNSFSQTLNKSYDKNYLRVFPTAFLQFDGSKQDQVNISYSSRIARPDYYRLNPFKFYISSDYYLTGNPFLLPAITQNVSIGNLHKNKYYFSVSFSTTKDRFTNLAIQDYTRNVLVDSQYNINRSWYVGFDLYTPFNIKKLIDINNYLFVAHRDNSITIQGTDIKDNIWRFYDQLNIVVSPPWKLKAKLELSGSYTSKDIIGLSHFKDMYDVTAAIRVPFNGGKTNLTLSVSDIFYSSIYDVHVNYLDQENGFREKNDSRIFSLRLSHRFGTKKKIEAKKNDKMNNEERDRLKSS